MTTLLSGANAVEGTVLPLVNALTYVVGLGLLQVSQLGLLGLLS
ncbi:hypothetical protein ABZ734_22230 [Streptomyces sp. NPDC006660]